MKSIKYFLFVLLLSFCIFYNPSIVFADVETRWAKSTINIAPEYSWFNGSPGYSQFNSNAVDSDNNIYAAGYITSSSNFNFGNNVTVNGEFEDKNAVLTKYNSAGVTQWAVSTAAKGPNISLYNSVAVDSDNNIYAAGYIMGSENFNFNNNVIVTSGNPYKNPVLVKYNSSGVAQWAVSITTSGEPSTSSFSSTVIDLSGNIYVVGSIKGPSTFNFGNNVIIVSESSIVSPIVVKYNSSGVAQWAVSATVSGVSDNFDFRSVSLDSDNNIYTAGNFYGTGTYNFGNNVTVTGASSYKNPVVVKYNSSGVAQWAVSTAAGESDDSAFYGIVADSDHNIYATGTIGGTSTYNFGNNVTIAGESSSDNAVVVKYNSSGVAQWAVSTAAGESDDSAFYGIVADSDHNIYAAGYLLGTSALTFGNNVTLNTGNSGYNPVVVKYNSSGVAQWVMSTLEGSQDSDDSDSEFYGITSDLDNNIYAVGNIDNNGNYNFGNNVTVSDSYGVGSAVIVKYVNSTESISTTTTDHNNTYIPPFDFNSPTELVTQDLVFHSISDIVADSQGNIYVADSATYNIKKLDHNNNTWSEITKEVDGVGNLIYRPGAITVDNQGTLYLANVTHFTKYNPDTNAYTVFDIATSGPKGVATDNDGNIFISDTDNNRLLKYSIGTSSWSTIDHQIISPGGLQIAAGYLYVTSIYGSKIHILNIQENTWTTMGERGVNVGQFESPEDVFIDSTGNIYVADTGNHRAQKYDIGTSTWTVVSKTNVSGSLLGDGSLQSPKAIYVDNNGNIYAGEGNIIQKYNKDTNNWTSIGLWGWEGGKFYHPQRISFDKNDNMYVADTGNDRIQKYDNSSKSWIVMGSQGTGPGEFNWPRGLVVDKKGNIYVSDTNNHRVQKFDIKTNIWSIIATEGELSGQVILPIGMSVDSQDNIYIADSGNNRIQKYNPQTNSWTTIGEYGSSLGNFYNPNGVDIDKNDNIYVADTSNNRIQKYNVETSTWSSYGSSGYNLGKFNNPIDISVDNKGYIYVSDAGNWRLQKFNLISHSSTAMWLEGIGDGWAGPSGIALDHNNNLYVVDELHNRIQKLWYYNLAQYSASNNGSITGLSLQKLSEGETSTSVTAVPNHGYTFLRWSDGLANNPRTDVGGSGAITATAKFGQSNKTVSVINSTILQDEVTNYYISIASTNPTTTPNFTFNVNYTFTAGEAEIIIPADTVVSSTDDTNLDLTQFNTTINTDEVKPVLNQALASVKIGIPNAKLSFSKSITITIPVNSSYNGKTLQVKYRREGDSQDDWNDETTCLVSEGNCTFQTNHATTFAALPIPESSSNENNSSASTPSVTTYIPDHTCHDAKPLFISDLFQINTTNNSAKLYFTPQADNNNYFVSFSTNSSAEEHGEQVSLLKEGVQSHTIYQLKPNTTYYVKVRGQNGCMPGEWSNIMKFKTNSSIYYKSYATTLASNVKSIIKTTVGKISPSTKTVETKVDTTTDKQETTAPVVNTASEKEIVPQATQSEKAKKCFLWWCW